MCEAHSDEQCPPQMCVMCEHFTYEEDSIWHDEENHVRFGCTNRLSPNRWTHYGFDTKYDAVSFASDLMRADDCEDFANVND